MYLLIHVRRPNLLTHIHVNVILEGSDIWFLKIYEKNIQSDIFLVVYYLTLFDITKTILKCISKHINNIPCGSRAMSI